MKAMWFWILETFFGFKSPRKKINKHRECSPHAMEAVDKKRRRRDRRI